MELLKTSCAQRVLEGAGSTARVARCKRRSWLSSGRIIMRWRVSPTGLRYVYSVVCTMVMRAMFAPCGASGGAMGHLFPAGTYLIIRKVRFARRLGRIFSLMTPLSCAQLTGVGGGGPREQRGGLRPRRRLLIDRSRMGGFAIAAAAAISLMSLPSPLAAQSADSDA